MPKRTKIYEQFHGGLNSKDSHRDIADHELTDAQDVMVDKVVVCPFSGLRLLEHNLDGGDMCSRRDRDALVDAVG